MAGNMMIAPAPAYAQCSSTTEGPDSYGTRYEGPTSCGSNYTLSTSCGPYEWGDGWVDLNTCVHHDAYWRTCTRTCSYNGPTYHTYYATLTYNANQGTGAPANPAAKSIYAPSPSGSATYTISSTQPTRKGYKFLGWDTNSKATKPTYPKDKSSKISVSYGSSKTLYAIWQKTASSKLIYHAGPNASDPVVQYTRDEGSTLKLYDFGDTNLKSKGFTVPSGMRFDHWNTKSDGSGTVYKAGTTFTYGATDVNLYPVFVSELTQMPSTGVNGSILLGLSMMFLMGSMILHRRNRSANK